MNHSSFFLDVFPLPITNEWFAMRIANHSFVYIPSEIESEVEHDGVVVG